MFTDQTPFLAFPCEINLSSATLRAIFCNREELQPDPVGYLVKSLIQNEIEFESLWHYMNKKSLKCCLRPDIL